MKIRKSLCIGFLSFMCTVFSANSFTDFFKPDFDASLDDVKTTADKTKDSKVTAEKNKKVTIKKAIKINKGNLCIDVREKSGTFGIYVKDMDGNLIPIISDFDEYSSTFFGLEINKAFYKLNTAGGIKSTVTTTDNKAVFEYKIDNVASVIISMTCISSESDVPADTIRFDMKVTNTGKKQQIMGLRSVFDTVLGENTGIHFSTDQKKKINTEMILSPINNEKWISCTDGKNTAVFIIGGNRVERPDVVCLANKDVLGQLIWDPSIVAGRSFSSVISYNNSAIGFSWRLVRLMPFKSFSKRFYIVIGTNNQQPRTASFLFNDIQKSNIETPSVSSQQEKIISESENRQKKTIEQPAQQEQKINRKSKINDAEFDVNSITSEQLDPVYVQNLIDKINSLETEDESINREELLKLNTELDAILKKLRQRS